MEMSSSEEIDSESPPERSINDLPEEILIHIISFLPMEHAWKTSFVARSWRYLWLCVPRLTINMDSGLLSGVSHRSISKFIADTLDRRPEHLPLQKFKFRSGNKETTEHFNSWLQPLIKTNVEELDLTFFIWKDSFPVMFPNWETSMCHPFPETPNWDSTLFCDLLRSSVRVLKLYGVSIKFPDQRLRLESIREVYLTYVSTTNTEIADFVASCVHLQSLSLWDWRGRSKFQNLKIVSQTLEHLTLLWLNHDRRELSVEICAPSLVSLKVSLVYADKFTLESSSSLLEAHVDWNRFSGIDFKTWNLLSCLSGIEFLTSETTWLYNQLQLEDQALIFQNLKHVCLLLRFSMTDIRGLEILLRRCPQLATMVLRHSSIFQLYDCPSELQVATLALGDFVQYLKPDASKHIVFQMPHLRLVEIKGYRKTKMEMKVIELLKKHGIVLEKIVAYPEKVNGKSQPPIVL